MAKTYTIKTVDGMEFTAPTQAEAIALAKAYDAERGKKPSTSAGKGKVKDATFTKHDGTTVQCTQAQKQVWEKYRDGYTDRVANKEANLKAWADKREGYKPSKALKDAIKADRTSITHKVAKEKYNFVGTKDDLKALKASICK